MPKRKRTYKKPSSSKRGKYAGNSLSQAVTPKSILRKLRYTDVVQLNASTGAQDNYVFSANGIFDPDITSTGHQPTGFDQYMLMYDHYKIVGSKITVKFAPNTGSGAQSEQQVCSIKLQDSNTTTSDFRVGIENGQSSWTIISAGEGSTIKTISKGFSSKKTFPSRLTSATLVGTASANPVEQMYFVISAGALFSSHDPAAFNLLVVIDYTVVFSERKQLALS